MKKVLILVLGLSMTAASCNLLGGGASGTKGVLKSEDGGETFTAVNKINDDTNINSMNVNAFVSDPVDSDVMYIGSSSGVYKTTNAAENWEHKLSGVRIGDIAVDPSKTDIIYAVGLGKTNGIIVKTTDGGATWKEIYNEPTKNNAVLSIAISRANSKVLLAGLNNGELLRSVDEGMTWQLVKDLANPVTELEYFNNTSAYALTLNNGLYVSNDQGSNWSQIVSNVQTTGTGTTAYRTNNSSASIYYDVAFDPKLSGVIFLATQKGLLRSIDGGLNWTIMTLPVTNETLSVSAVAINPTNSNNLLITVGSTIFKTANGGVTWETKKLPSEQNIRHIVINRLEPNIVYLGIGAK